MAVFGVWINANTGKITTNDESIWLEEKDIFDKNSKSEKYSN